MIGMRIIFVACVPKTSPAGFFVVAKSAGRNWEKCRRRIMTETEKNKWTQWLTRMLEAVENDRVDSMWSRTQYDESKMPQVIHVKVFVAQKDVT